eukprot:3548888-Amphidinium_carterae.1
MPHLDVLHHFMALRRIEPLVLNSRESLEAFEVTLAANIRVALRLRLAFVVESITAYCNTLHYYMHYMWVGLTNFGLDCPKKHYMHTK